MAYFAPYVDKTGYHIPTYQDILDDIVNKSKGIYGFDQVTDISSQDYELMSVFAKYIYDNMLVSQMAYTNRAPSTVLGGEPQDSLYTINGIRRKPATFSTCAVKCFGTAGTIISKGVVKDIANNLWNLTPEVTIGLDGTVEVTATAQKPGRLIALPNDIRFINTPTFGWTSVTNETTSDAGSLVESDQEFRMRRMQSVSNPSRAVMDGIIGSIAAIEGVNRYRGYENDTGSVDANGIPAHTICMVVEGGDKQEIGKQIYLHKTPGCGTYGDQEVIIYDEFNNPNSRKFFYATYQQVYTTITIQKLTYFNEDTVNIIKARVQTYINTREIGQEIIPAIILAEALQANVNLSAPTFSVLSVTAGLSPTVQSTNNVPINFNSIAITSIPNIKIIEM